MPQSYLIISKNQDARVEYCNKLCDELLISEFDRTMVEIQTDTAKKSDKVPKSIGIEEIRIFQKKLFLKPLKSMLKAGIIHANDTLTIQAQNALLKVFEEPPENTILILTSTNKEMIIETLCSRCTIITLTDKKDSEFDKKEVEQFLTILESPKIDEKLKIAEVYAKDKAKTLELIDQAIQRKRNELLEYIEENEKTTLNVKIIQDLQNCYTTLKKTNVNTRMTLEFLFLS